MYCRVVGFLCCFLFQSLVADLAFSNGIGIVTGGTKGISFKTQKYGSPIEGALFLGNRTVIQAHYLTQNKHLYYGVGGRIGFDRADSVEKDFPRFFLLKKGKKDKKDDDKGGKGGDDPTGSFTSLLDDFRVRAPIGFRKLFGDFEVFGEIGFLLDIESDNGIKSEIAYGVRFFF